ncbi:MAG: DNA polymerase III subunit delta' [Rhodospirillales bacterium]
MTDEFDIDDAGDPLTPRENPDLLGHEAAEATLLDAYLGGRLAHAWLISGPTGIGKATLAYRFARFVLARGGPKAGGPNLPGDAAPKESPQEIPGSLFVAPDRPVFRRVAAGGHADLFTVERTTDEKGRLRSEIVVADVRALGRFFGLTAGEGGWRVAVVDSADELNRNAANALLKVLEEPPDRGLLLLVSHNPGRLLATIRSRCRKLALQSLAEETVAALLRDRVASLGAEDTASLAHLADGSPGRALALAAEGGLALYRDMTGLLETLPALDVGALHAFGQRLGRAGAEEAFETASALLRWWLARLIVAAAGGEAGTTRFTPEERALMGRLAAAAGLDRWFEVWEKINRLLARTGRANLDRKQVVLNVFLAIENTVRP